MDGGWRQSGEGVEEEMFGGLEVWRSGGSGSLEVWKFRGFGSLEVWKFRSLES